MKKMKERWRNDEGWRKMKKEEQEEKERRRRRDDVGKSRRKEEGWRMKDEGWRMKDEGWRMKDEGRMKEESFPVQQAGRKMVDRKSLLDGQNSLLDVQPHSYLPSSNQQNSGHLRLLPPDFLVPLLPPPSVSAIYPFPSMSLSIGDWNDWIDSLIRVGYYNKMV
jgi:hypothetical protein